MGAPKETVKTPVSKNIKYVKKANMWCYSINYNHENSSDIIKWFNTEELAKEAFLNDIKSVQGGEK